MKQTFSILLIAAAISATPVIAQTPATPAATNKPAIKLPPQAPDVAAPKLGPDGKPNAGFIKAHENFLKIAKEGQTDLLFLGDSITAGWAGRKEIWTNAFGAYKPSNFGIGGDRTQHVLWRINNGELEGIKPKTIVLMIGTNNSGSDPADGIADGITKIVQAIQNKLPGTKILLLAVFPRGASPNPQREKLKQVNSTIAKLDNGKSVYFMDIGDKFMETDGTISKEIMPDYLHLSAKGYQIWADAITPKLAQLMK